LIQAYYDKHVNDFSDLIRVKKELKKSITNQEFKKLYGELVKLYNSEIKYTNRTYYDKFIQYKTCKCFDLYTVFKQLTSELKTITNKEDYMKKKAEVEQAKQNFVTFRDSLFYVDYDKGKHGTMKEHLFLFVNSDERKLFSKNKVTYAENEAKIREETMRKERLLAVEEKRKAIEKQEEEKRVHEEKMKILQSMTAEELRSFIGLYALDVVKNTSLEKIADIKN
jgi:hypothetical protein